ncbi:response regulator [Desulfovibrio cuneatus]|uniref:response regulator n=1 Tax=Desulfovibrio cuneatus TaxID=159728 RepID=UPI0003F8F466|nr:response regulator [Desulfovibrio cuneatus]
MQEAPQSPHHSAPLPPKGKRNIPLVVFGVLLLTVGISMLVSEHQALRQAQAEDVQQRTSAIILFMNKTRSQVTTWAQAMGTEFSRLSTAATKSWQPTLFLQNWPAAKVLIFSKDNKLQREVKKPLNDKEGMSAFETLVMRSDEMTNILRQTTPTDPQEGFVWLGDRLYLIATAAMPGQQAGSLVAVVPMDARILRQLKQYIIADVVVLPTEETAKLRLEVQPDLPGTLGVANGKNLSATITPGLASSLHSSIDPSREYTISLIALPSALGEEVGSFAVLGTPFTLESTNLFLASAFMIAIGFICFLLGLLKKSTDIPSSAMAPTAEAAFLPALQNHGAPSRIFSTRRSEKLKNKFGEAHNTNIAIQYQRFFDSAPLGIFRCAPDGKLLQTNQTLASMLGYESSVHLLTEHASLFDFFPKDQDIHTILNALREKPGVRHPVDLATHNGVVCSFWIVSIAAFEAQERLPIEGFLLDRSQEEELGTLEEKYTQAKNDRANIALLLASASKQVLSYLLPVRSPSTHFTQQSVQSASAPREERRLGVSTLNAVFKDIYELALYEADQPKIVSTTVNLRRILDELQYQIAPALLDKSLKFECIIAEDTPTAVQSFAPLLRHTLLRSLLFILRDETEGLISLAVRADIEGFASATPSLIFTISWEKDRTDETEPPDLETLAASASAGTLDPIEEPGTPAGSQRLEFEQEFSVIQYLTQRLNGNVPQASASNNERFLQIIAPFDFTAAATDLYTITKANNLNSSSDAPTGEAEAISRGLAAQYGIVEDLPSTPLETSRSSSSNLAEGMMEQEDTAKPLDLLVLDEVAGTGEEDASTQEQGEALDILLVEDSAHNRLLFSLYLRGTPHRITEAADGLEGLERFKEKRYDIIFMDMEMPNMDGYQATRIMRALESEADVPPVPIVAQTAHVLPAFKAHSMEAGCTAFLSKPYSKHNLLAIIDTVKNGGQA